MGKSKIDFQDIAKQTGIRKGKIFRSKTFNCWVVSGGDVHLTVIEPPKIDGKEPVRIEDDHWIY